MEKDKNSEPAAAVQIKESVDNSVDLYHYTRKKMVDSVDDYDYYRCLRSAIKTGMSILGMKHKLSIRGQVLLDKTDFIVDRKNDMEWISDRGVYNLSRPADEVGTIEVLPTNVEIGLRSLQCQLANNANKLLDHIDQEIYNELSSSGKIKKDLSLGDLIKHWEKE